MKTETTKSKCWLADKSYAEHLSCGVDDFGKVDSGVLFKTKTDANFAGWDRPVRVELTVRVL